MRHVTGGVAHGRVTTFITLTDSGKPLPPTNEAEHELHGFCWCQPRVETGDVTGDHLFIHRRTVDSPHVETGRPG